MAVAIFELLCDSCGSSRKLVREKCNESVVAPQGHIMSWDCVALHVK